MIPFVTVIFPSFRLRLAQAALFLIKAAGTVSFMLEKTGYTGSALSTLDNKRTMP